MLVARAALDIGLVDVISPDRVEGSDVAGHARHETGQQRRQSESEYACREVMQQHLRNRQVIIKLRLTVLVELGLALLVGLYGNQSFALRRTARRALDDGLRRSGVGQRMAGVALR